VESPFGAASAGAGLPPGKPRGDGAENDSILLVLLIAAPMVTCAVSGSFQVANVGWKRLIPLGTAVIPVNAVVGMLKGW